ncbi:MAG: hypothetical protein ABSF47_00925 [Minisyncoccia bacterium]|jgi:hypothetical protein
MKKFLISSFTVFFGLSLFFARPVFADNGTSTVQKALQNAKQFLDDLVTAKDENSGDDVGLRIQTFSQVLNLSEAEAKDFEFKLLAADKDAKLDAWKKLTLNEFDGAITFFDSQKDLVSNAKTINLAKIKQVAQDFKSWRAANYLPLVSQAQSFLLIKQEAKAIETAQTRLEKITGDLENLNQTRISGSGDINNSLMRSRQNISDAVDLNNQAYDLFSQNYGVENAPMVSSTDLVATSSDSTDATSTDGAAYSTFTASSSLTADAVPNPIVSIKDLVGSSLSKIKDAYQNFIDISNLVRKLLG